MAPLAQNPALRPLEHWYRGEIKTGIKCRGGIWTEFSSNISRVYPPPARYVNGGMERTVRQAAGVVEEDFGVRAGGRDLPGTWMDDGKAVSWKLEVILQSAPRIRKPPIKPTGLSIGKRYWLCDY